MQGWHEKKPSPQKPAKKIKNQPRSGFLCSFLLLFFYGVFIVNHITFYLNIFKARLKCEFCIELIENGTNICKFMTETTVFPLVVGFC